MTTKLTDPRVFEPRHFCTGCGLDLANYDEHTPLGPCAHVEFRPENTRHYLPTAADVAAITCLRAPGHREPNTYAGGALVDIPQTFVYHSPTGFEWGYGGSGPADLALNVLALFVPLPEAWRLHQRYKFAVIARLPREGGTITAYSVRRWIDATWKAEATNAPTS